MEFAACRLRITQKRLGALVALGGRPDMHAHSRATAEKEPVSSMRAATPNASTRSICLEKRIRPERESGLSLRDNRPLTKPGRAETYLTMETPTNYKTLVAASLMSIALTSAAFAQCVDCALYPDRDVLNNGAPTPASKQGLTRPGGAPGANTANSENSARNARAEARDHHLQRSGHRSGVDGNPAK
jgi:hypothetical protein